MLSKLNDRSYRSLENDVEVTFEFSVVKVGDLVPLGTGAPDRPFSRSGTLEIELDTGDYVVYVKLDQSRELDPSSDYADWDVSFGQSYPDLENVSVSILRLEPGADGLCVVGQPGYIQDSDQQSQSTVLG